MSSDAETQRLLGGLCIDVKHLLDRQEVMEKKLDEVVAMTNRWKGATAILIIIGGIVGWASNLLIKLLGKG
jgi:hypothetical protein